MKKWMVVLYAGAMAACPAAWANFTCSGPITYLGVSSASTLYVTVASFGVWPICNLAGPYSSGGTTVNVDSCKAWYAALLTQKVTGGTATLYFTSAAGTANGPECTAMGTWVTLNPLPYHIDYWQ